MANYANLLATIAANIYTNNNNEVTAAMVKSAVDQMVASLGAGYQFMGVATPATIPGNTDVKQFYIASEAGSYTGFGSFTISRNELCFFLYDSSWTMIKIIVPIGKKVTSGEFIWAITDDDDHFLLGIRTDGSFEYAKGVPAPLASVIQDLADSLGGKVDKISGSQLVKSNYVKEISNSEFIYAMTDANDRVLWGVRTDGSFFTALDEQPGDGKDVLDFYFPEKIFEVINDIPYVNDGGVLDNKEFTREYLNTIYPDRLYIGGACPFADGLGSKVLSTPIRWRQDIATATTEQSFEISFGGNGFKKVSGSFGLISTKSSVALGQNITLMPIGDSITLGSNAGFWDKSGDWSFPNFVAELFEMDDIDNQEDNGAAAGAVKCHLVGTMKGATRSVTYRGHTIDHSDDCSEGRGGWAVCDYLRHPFDMAPTTGDYDILGLRTAVGDPSLLPDEQVYQLIANTCWGIYPPDITEASWNRFRNRIGHGNVSWADATAAMKQELEDWATTTIVNNPSNPFYSKADYNAMTNTMFSWSAYYNRYKTYQDDAETPLSTPGTDHIPGTIVCVPKYISIALGANDSTFMRTQGEIAADIMTMADLLRTATSAKILVLTTGWPASQIPMYHPNLSQFKDTYTDARLHLPFLRNKAICTAAGDLTEQAANGIYICPSFYVQGFDTSRTHKNESLGTDFDYDFSWDTEDVHPGPGGHRQIGYQLYSLIMYLLS